MWALEEDVRKAALASAVRDELAAAQLELQGKQRSKAREWETGACAWRRGGSALMTPIFSPHNLRDQHRAVKHGNSG